MSLPRAVVAGVVACLLSCAAGSALADNPKPRKVIVGTAMYGPWGSYPGLTARLAYLGTLIDAMAAQAQTKYGRNIDIACLPEETVTGSAPVALAGQVQDYFAAKARQYHCYVVVPLYLSEQQDGKTVLYNACALLDRHGALVGTYRKVHPVSTSTGHLEGEVLPGKDFPVFQCDFGKVGIQICYDLSYDDGWRALARQGAELVVYSSQTPSQIGLARNALEYRYWIVSSTWRTNASLYDPMGSLVRAITSGTVFAEEIDLEYVLLPWQANLNNGAAFDTAYPGKVGYRYLDTEDLGIFWSKDATKPILDMVRGLGLRLDTEMVGADKQLQDQVRGGPPPMPVGPLAVSGVFDWTWVYQNSPLATSGRNACKLSLFIEDDPNGNTRYSATVTQAAASSGKVAILPTADPLVWTISGGQRGLDPTGTVTLTITASGLDCGGQGTAGTVPLAVCPLGDISKNGTVAADDKALIIQAQNGLPTSTATTRDLDLNGDGAVTTADLAIVVRLLNGLPVP